MTHAQSPFARSEYFGAKTDKHRRPRRASHKRGGPGPRPPLQLSRRMGSCPQQDSACTAKATMTPSSSAVRATATGPCETDVSSITHRLSPLLATATIASALVVSGCGGNTAKSTPAAARPATSSAHTTQTQAQSSTSTTQDHSRASATARTTTAEGAPSTAASAGASAGIPQGNGGDQDADNNGGPSDGDGNI
jgi:hypothetical protein